MPHQQNLFPPDDPDAAATRAAQTSPSPAPIWLQRLSMVILVGFCLYVGLLLFFLPWTRYWQENHYLLTIPALGPLLSSGFAKGVISGIGLIDLWIALSEIIHYSDYRA